MTGRMGYGSTGLEFLRFGSSIPGSYWGCCACCIIQNFNSDPDSKASVQKVSGDGGEACGDQFYGPTQRDIFNQRLREGTFGSRDMPNHAFLAILTQNQLNGEVGKKWLAILKESGFEFIRTVCNSVYAGASLGKPSGAGQAQNYIFGLFRNIGTGAPADQFTPPKEWLAIPGGKPTLLDFDLANNSLPVLTFDQATFDTEVWNRIGPSKLMTAKQIEEAGAPVVLAGQRGEYPQESKGSRDAYRAMKADNLKRKIDNVLKAAFDGKYDDWARERAYRAAGVTVTDKSAALSPQPVSSTDPAIPA